MRLPRLKLLVLAGMALFLGAADQSAPASESDAQSQLRQQLQAQSAHLAAVQNQAALAAAAQKQQQDLATQRISAAARLRDLDTAVGRATMQMQALRAQTAEAEAARDKAAQALGPMLPLIERLALYPSETLLAAPGTTSDSLRALMAARGLSRILGNQAAVWRGEQAKVAASEAALNQQAQSLVTARRAQSKASGALDQQIAAANQAEQTANQAAQQEQALAAQAAAKADTLRGLVAGLAAQRAAGEKALAQHRATTDAAAADLAAKIAAAPRIKLDKNALLVPVSGKLVHDFGSDTGAGPATGLTYEAAPKARVVAPCSGTVVFADSFRSFGPMIILDCGNSIHFVLAGLARLDVQVGTSLRAGEPVGTMPDWTDTTAARPALYLELRRGGQPIDPAPYFAQSS
jgi:septal ring factor EnvC (AmiA/AmiB activator)